MHCAVATWVGKVRVRDLKSRNGTFVNGQRINGEVSVNHGDRLQVGSLEFAIQISEDDEICGTQPIRKSEVQWLLDSPPDPTVLSPRRSTVLVTADAEGARDATEKLTNGTTETKRNTKAVSAGQHLVDYFEHRKTARPA
jgi:predicted component of type VI protein secretion system